MKARKLFWDNYLEENWSNIFTDEVVFKGEKMRSRSGFQNVKSIIYLR